MSNWLRDNRTLVIRLTAGSIVMFIGGLIATQRPSQRLLAQMGQRQEARN